MKVFSKAKTGLKRIFGVKEVVGNYQTVKSLAQEVYQYDTHKIKPLGKAVYVPVAFLNERARQFRNLFFLFAFMLVISVFYFFYALFHHKLMAALLIFCFCLFMAALCFRYHFWWFQVRKRKLGCSFEEWKEGVLQDLKGGTK